MANPYATPLQLLNFSLTSGSFENQPTANVQFFLDDAAGYIDAALRPRHPLPLNDVPVMLSQWCIVIAAYNLWLAQGINPGTGTAILEQKYREVMGVPENHHSGFLAKLAEGTISIGHQIDKVQKSPTPMFPVVDAGADRKWNASVRGEDGRKKDVIVG